MSLFDTETAKIAARFRWNKLQKEQLKFFESRKIKYADSLVKLHAYLCSDGWVGTNIEKNGSIKYNIVFYPDHIKLAKDFVNVFRDLYGLEPSIKEVKNFYRVSIRNRVAYNTLIKFGNYSSLKWRIPFDILSNNHKASLWLACFIDCDGYVSKKGPIQIQSVNKKGINDIKNLLESLSVNSTLTEYTRKNKNWNKNYILTINKSYVSKSKNLFKLLHPMKMARLLKLYADVS